MIAVAAALSAVLSGDPAACAVALLSGFVALAARRDLRRLASRPSGARVVPAGDADAALTTTVFRTFQPDDAPPSAGLHEAEGHEAEDPEDAGSSEPPSKSEEAEETDRFFEEFAAGLEEGSEEISFLPPYVSGGDSGGIDEDDDGAWEPPIVDSPLLQELTDVLDPRSRMPMPRRFALGTVAILRNLLDPDQVTRILDEQRRYPRLRFGDIAVELGLLTTAERDELVRAQQEGVFSDDEIRDAKRRLESHYARAGRRGAI